MRHVLLVSLALSACAAGSPAFCSDILSPPETPVHQTFVQTWTALPTGRFAQMGPASSFQLARASARALPDATLAPLLDGAFASARDGVERRNIALNEMMAPWDQAKRTTFQHLRDAEAAYAGTRDARQDRFVATLARVVDGTGRSAAVDGPSSADLDKAYAARLARAPGDARVATEADQARWRNYSDAFATFADLQSPGSAAEVGAELARQRLSDLDATSR